MKITKKDTITGIISWICTVGALAVFNYLQFSPLITFFEAIAWVLYSVATVMLVGYVIALHTSEELVTDLIDKIEENPDKYSFKWTNVVSIVSFLIPTVAVFSYYNYVGLLVLYILMTGSTIYFNYLTNVFSKMVSDIKELESEDGFMTDEEIDKMFDDVMDKYGTNENKNSYK